MSRVVRSVLRPLVLGTLVMLVLGGAALAQQPSQALEELRERYQAYWQDQDYARAREAAERALQLVLREFGREHEQTALQHFSLGLIAQAMGDHARAERYFADTVRVREKVYGPDSVSVAIALEHQGHALLKSGRPQAAEKLFRRALGDEAERGRRRPCLQCGRARQSGRRGARARAMGVGARLLSPGDPAAHGPGQVLRRGAPDRGAGGGRISRHLRGAQPGELAPGLGGEGGQGGNPGGDVRGSAARVADVGGLRAGQDDGAPRRKRHGAGPAHPARAGSGRPRAGPARRGPEAAHQLVRRAEGRSGLQPRRWRSFAPPASHATATRRQR